MSTETLQTTSEISTKWTPLPCISFLWKQGDIRDTLKLENCKICTHHHPGSAVGDSPWVDAVLWPGSADQNPQSFSPSPKPGPGTSAYSQGPFPSKSSPGSVEVELAGSGDCSLGKQRQVDHCWGKSCSSCPHSWSQLCGKNMT